MDTKQYLNSVSLSLVSKILLSVCCVGQLVGCQLMLSEQQFVEHSNLIAETKRTNTFQQHTTHTLIIFYDKTKNLAPLYKILHDNNGAIVYQYKMLHGMAVKFPNTTLMPSIIKQLQKVDGVLSVQQDSMQTAVS